MACIERVTDTQRPTLIVHTFYICLSLMLRMAIDEWSLVPV